MSFRNVSLELIRPVYAALKQEKGIEESESEDEDADFEVEIEEALESDIEEGVDGIGRKRKRARRPVTRGKRRKRESVQNKVLYTGRAKAPLRPLLPYAENVLVGERSRCLAGSASRPWICGADRHPSDCWFTAHQIGQLYCLMHEHVQLLLQVYAMCILEPAMQQTAVDTHRMLMELVEKREAVLSWKMSAFPDFCFRPPYIHPSIPQNEISSLSSETPPVVRSRDGASSTRVSSSSGPHQSVVSTESMVPLDSNSTSTDNTYLASPYQFCGYYIKRNQAISSSSPSSGLASEPSFSFLRDLRFSLSSEITCTQVWPRCVLCIALQFRRNQSITPVEVDRLFPRRQLFRSLYPWNGCRQPQAL